MLQLFRRKRVVINQTHFVRGVTFTPDALAYSPVASIPDPQFDSVVEASRNFHTLPATQPPMLYQGYVAPRAASVGYPYDAPNPSGLLSLDAAYSAKGVPDNYYG